MRNRREDGRRESGGPSQKKARVEEEDDDIIEIPGPSKDPEWDSDDEYLLRPDVLASIDAQVAACTQTAESAMFIKPLQKVKEGAELELPEASFEAPTSSATQPLPVQEADHHSEIRLLRTQLRRTTNELEAYRKQKQRQVGEIQILRAQNTQKESEKDRQSDEMQKRIMEYEKEQCRLKNQFKEIQQKLQDQIRFVEQERDCTAAMLKEEKERNKGLQTILTQTPATDPNHQSNGREPQLTKNKRREANVSTNINHQVSELRGDFPTRSSFLTVPPLNTSSSNAVSPSRTEPTLQTEDDELRLLGENSPGMLDSLASTSKVLTGKELGAVERRDEKVQTEDINDTCITDHLIDAELLSRFRCHLNTVDLSNYDPVKDLISIGSRVNFNFPPEIIRDLRTHGNSSLSKTELTQMSEKFSI